MTQRICLIVCLGAASLLLRQVAAASPMPSLSIQETTTSSTPAGNLPEVDRNDCEVVCQPGDLIECPEVPGPYHYLEDCDGGCHRTPPQFLHIEFEWPVCGVGFTYSCQGGANCRDTDWYEFLLPVYGIVRMDMQAEFPVLFGIIDYQPCDSADFIAYGTQTALCIPALTTTPCLPPGSYVAAVAPLYFTGVPVPKEYRTTVSYQPCQPPCAGTLQLDSHELSLPPTYVGAMSSASVVAHNPGSQMLCVDSVTTTGHVWRATPSSFTIAPGQWQSVQVDFLPTFDHDFEGTIEFFSSDSDHPRDSVTVSGIGCHPMVEPPAPILHSAACPTAIYFEMPWDSNRGLTRYMVEFSFDNFATADSLDCFAPDEEDSYWATAAHWGRYGLGAITDLEPSTVYQVRLRARDCTGAEVVGPSASLSTPPDIVVSSEPQLTILVVNADTVQLHWNPEVTDSLGNELPNLGYFVYVGDDPDTLDSLMDWSTTGSLDMALGASLKAFFYVEPVLEGIYDQPSPFISWPPEGATVEGWNSVVIQDLMHFSQWDSFTVEVNDELVGSSWDDPWGWNSLRMASVNFRDFAPGPVTVRIRVVDKHNRTYESTRGLTVYDAGPKDFTAQYDSVQQRFSLDTANVAYDPQAIREIYWPTSTAGERFGGHVEFEWDSTRDSVTMVAPFPIPINKILNEEGHWFSPNDTNVAVVPEPDQPVKKKNEVGQCCENVTITIGQPGYTCNRGLQKVAVKFKVEFTYRNVPMHMDAPTHGQDAKGDRIYTQGECTKNGDSITFTPIPSTTQVPNPAVRHHRYNDVNYPYDTTAWGNDNYRAGGTQWNILHNKLSWGDTPSDAVPRVKGHASRIVSRNKFKVWARPKCPELPAGRCCKTFEINWDVICCPDGTMKINQAPAIINLQPCPDE